jgi:DNA invertase Pin-like site-specific DNA recombinase
MAQALGYLRFSTKKQERGDSAERQLNAIRAHAASKGWDLAESDVIKDLGRSAWKGDHLNSGKLRLLSERIMSGEIEPGTIIIVEALDRLSRQGPQKARRWLEDVTERGIRIATVKGDKLFDATGLATNLVDVIEIFIAAKLAQEESDLKSMRVAGSWAKKLGPKARAGEVITSGCPGWLRPAGPDEEGEDGTPFIRIPERAALIRSIFIWAAAGDGLQRIVARLNSESGVAKWSRYGNGYSMTQVARWLRSSAPEGDLVPYEANNAKPNGERVVGYYPRIVEPDLVAQARAGLLSRRRTGGRKYQGTYQSLFVGLYRCAECGGRMNQERPTGPGYLHCADRKLGRGCTNRRFMKFKPFERAAIPEILHLSLDDRFFRSSGGATSKAAANAAEAAKAVDDLEERLANLTALMSRVKDPEPLITRYDNLTTELAQSKAAAAEAEKALRLARGQVSAEEHRQRVLTVAHAIEADHHEIRLEARQKVSEALKAVVQGVSFDPVDQTATLIMVGGLVSLKFNGDGKLIDRVDMLHDADDPAIRSAILSGAGRSARSYDAVFKRAVSSTRIDSADQQFE